MAITYNTSIVRSGLVLHLDAANPKSYPGSGTTWRDLSGNGNDFTLVGTTYSAVNNGSLIFSGGNSYASRASAGSFINGLGAVTLEMYVKADAIRADDLNGLFNSINPNNSDLVLTLRHDAVGAISSKVNVYKFGAGPVADITASESAENSLSSDWVHLALVWDKNQNSGADNLYINSQLSISAAQTYSTANIDSVTTAYIGIGSKNTVGTNSFAGKISLTRLYNRALTPLEISQNFEALRGRYNI